VKVENAAPTAANSSRVEELVASDLTELPKSVSQRDAAMPLEPALLPLSKRTPRRSAKKPMEPRELATSPLEFATKLQVSYLLF
jgi:hypothetical protein